MPGFSASCGEGRAGVAGAPKMPALRKYVWPTYRVSGQHGFWLLLSHWKWHPGHCTDVLVLEVCEMENSQDEAVGISSKWFNFEAVCKFVLSWHWCKNIFPLENNPTANPTAFPTCCCYWFGGFCFWWCFVSTPCCHLAARATIQCLCCSKPLHSNLFSVILLATADTPCFLIPM